MDTSRLRKHYSRSKCLAKVNIREKSAPFAENKKENVNKKQAKREEE
jgi:hypothetical protein